MAIPWHAYDNKVCTEAKQDPDPDLPIRSAYNEIFADRIHEDMREDRHYYNRLVPDYFTADQKDDLIRRANEYFDNCVRIASMDRDKFIDSLCERFETEKKEFERWRNRAMLDILDDMPENVIRGYLDMKGS